jgi:hypothetical protein
LYKKITLTRFFKETHKVILNTPSALMMGGRFKNATPVTVCAFVAILLIGHDVVLCHLLLRKTKTLQATITAKAS